jgi:DnaK suppressor protein
LVAIEETAVTQPPTACPYGPQFVEEQRARLAREREFVLEGIAGEREELIHWSTHDDSGIDQHMADDATALTEQELDVTLIDNARYIVSEIDEALHRIGIGTYGWDEEAGCWIREERLQALPWARREVAGQRRLEDRFRRSERDQYAIDADVRSL